MPPPNVKIKTGYVPKVKRKQQVVTQLCPRCNKAIPIEEMSEHVRIELLDPKWRENRDKYLAKQKESNVVDNGKIIAQSLNAIKQYRPDIFGGDEQAALAKLERERELKKIKERKVWDGYAASAANAQMAMKTSWEEQVREFKQIMEEQEKVGPQVPGAINPLKALVEAEESSFTHPLPKRPVDGGPAEYEEQSSKRPKIDDMRISEATFLMLNSGPAEITLHRSLTLTNDKHWTYPLPSIAFNLPLETTILQLKEMTFKKTNLPAKQMRLVLNTEGKLLDLKDDKSLAWYNFLEADIEVMTKK